MSEGRLNLLPEIIACLEQLADQENKSEKAELITAVEVSEEDTQKIKKQLEAQLSKTLSFSKKVDPNILGGFIVNIGQTRIDQSVRKSLKTIVHSVNTDV